jgi:hypothetical protein
MPTTVCAFYFEATGNILPCMADSSYPSINCAHLRFKLASITRIITKYMYGEDVSTFQNTFSNYTIQQLYTSPLHLVFPQQTRTFQQ